MPTCSPPARRTDQVVVSFFIVALTSSLAQYVSGQQTTPLGGTLLVKDLGRTAAYARPDERALQPIVPLAAKADGGAYIQWATAQGWNTGYRNVTSTVYVTEVDANGNVVAEDVMLGRSQPSGIVATPEGFACYLKDGHRLTFDRYSQGQKTGVVVLMDHGPEHVRPDTFRAGVDLRLRNDGKFPFGWAVPYAPFARGHGALVYGNGQVATIFSMWNNYQPSGNPPPEGWRAPNDAHLGSTVWLYGNNPAVHHHMSYSTGDHSLDQRMIFANGNFYSVSLNPHIVFQRYDGRGNRARRAVLFENPSPYTQANGASIPDSTVKEVRDGSGNWQARTEFVEASGYTLGRLGDLHDLGNQTFALTYGYAAWGNHQLRSAKNQVDLAILDSDGNVLSRKVIAYADHRAGQNGHTVYSPYERIKWVKSAMVRGNILVVWATERRGSRELQTYMALANRQGNVVNGPHHLPATTARFSFNDRIRELRSGTLAWTDASQGSLRLYLLNL